MVREATSVVPSADGPRSRPANGPAWFARELPATARPAANSLRARLPNHLDNIVGWALARLPHTGRAKAHPTAKLPKRFVTAA